MEINQIIKEVNKIFIDVLDSEDLVLTPESSAKTIEEWDSLNHILLVVAIEKHFKIKFTTAQIQGWNNVGELCNSISGKLSV
jgi:acyl carrier protein